jgi:2-keto-4-pentenoate hydratase/2-oxohepta-3-ene-1,7-dioic acid hydratase in catechol pathway
MSMRPTKCKNFANGIGPWVTTIDEFGDLSGLEMTVRINDKECGRGFSSGMQWSPQELLAYISQGDAVQPGDVFGSGTVGNGCGLESGVRAKPGDIIELEISGIGLLRQVLGQKEERGWWPKPRVRTPKLAHELPAS